MIRKTILAVVCVVFLCLAGLICFIVFTERGGVFILQKSLNSGVPHGEFSIEESEGDLMHGMELRNLELKDIKGLPAGSVLKIQRLFLDLTELGIKGFVVEINNARLIIPGSYPVVLNGNLKNEQLDLNIFSKGFTVTEVASLFPDLSKLIPIKGEVGNIDLFISGHYLEPAVKGELVIRKFVYKGFQLTNVPLNADIQLKDVKKDVALHGIVQLKQGDFQTERVLVRLEPGDLRFFGLWDQPMINLKGNARIETIRIEIGLKGTIEEPDLVLSSDPPYSRQKLMVMLATGKRWKSVEDSLDNGTLNSAALTKDFIDYFFFAGKSNKFAQRFGITDFSVQYEENKQGIAAKKAITENLEVGYGIEQTKANGQVTDVSQKLGGEVKVNKQISVGVEREISQKQQVDELLDEQLITESEDKIYLKYKKTF